MPAGSQVTVKLKFSVLPLKLIVPVWLDPGGKPPAGPIPPAATDRIEAIRRNKHIEQSIRRAAAGIKAADTRAEDIATAGAKREQEAVIAIHAKPIKARLQLQESLDVHRVPIRGG